MLAGCWRRDVVKFNALAAESQAGQMMLAISAMLVPALFFRVAQESHQERLIHPVSLGVSVVLLVSYALGLLFAFVTHRDRLNAMAHSETAHDEAWSIRPRPGLLVVASVLMGVVAEGLVHASARRKGVGTERGLSRLHRPGDRRERRGALDRGDARRSRPDGHALNISMQSERSDRIVERDRTA